MNGANLETKILQGSIIFLMISALFMTTMLCTSCDDDDQTKAINGTSILSNTENSTLIKTWYDVEQGAYDIPEWIYPVDLKSKDETAQISKDINGYHKDENNS